MNDLDFTGGEKIIYHLNRCRLKGLCQCITNFKQHSVGRNERPAFKFRGQIERS